MDDLVSSIRAATSGLAAQSTRLRVVAENLANASSTGTSPEDAPYQRQTIIFKSEFDAARRTRLVSVDRIATDRSPFRVQHDPGHPAADAEGNVRLPNVSPLIELADMRDANRSYEANLAIIRISRELVRSTLDLLKG